MYKFGPASAHESIVFGAARPGYRDGQVAEWIAWMQGQRIRRVCCLLSEVQLKRYGYLLDGYRQAFGVDAVCWTPISDFQLVTPRQWMDQILPFLGRANQHQERVVVHCSGGVGRTGHVLAAWLVAGRGFTHSAAIAAVKGMGRNPYEAAITAPFLGRNPWTVVAELNRLLGDCYDLNP